jgi:hypothetical protein
MQPVSCRIVFAVRLVTHAPGDGNNWDPQRHGDRHCVARQNEERAKIICHMLIKKIK